MELPGRTEDLSSSLCRIFEVVKSCIARFEKASRQSVILGKSHIFFFPNLDVAKTLELSSAVNMPRMDDLGRYFGACLIHQQCNTVTYEDLARYNKWLFECIARCVSLERRITLAKSRLNTLPTF